MLTRTFMLSIGTDMDDVDLGRLRRQANKGENSAQARRACTSEHRILALRRSTALT
jgi:hypothetical protein